VPTNKKVQLNVWASGIENSLLVSTAQLSINRTTLIQYCRARNDWCTNNRSP